MSESLTVKAVVAIDAGRVAVLVSPPFGLDLQWIYRAGISIYWNKEESRLEDRYTREVSQTASFKRIASALADEYGMRLRPGSDVKWERIANEARKEIELEFEST